MAVTIDEMQVDVTDAQPQSASAGPGPDAQERVDLRTALDMLRERELRLRAE